jgi:hypothetical protein
MNVGTRSTIRVEDDLAYLDISRQRKYQIRKMRQGLCIICGQKSFRGTLFCLSHNRKRGIKNPGRNKPYGAAKWNLLRRAKSTARAS